MPSVSNPSLPGPGPVDDLTVINLFAGPGAGKSTIAAGLFAELKRAGESVELVTEFAKDLTWENGVELLRCQPYVLGEQYRRLERLRGKVKLAITDSPLLLQSYYAGNAYPESFHDFIRWSHERFPSLNAFVQRVGRYDSAGRWQDEAAAVAIDRVLQHSMGIRYDLVVPGDRTAPDRIIEVLQKRNLLRRAIPRAACDGPTALEGPEPGGHRLSAPATLHARWLAAWLMLGPLRPRHTCGPSRIRPTSSLA
jgi:hypothetical protein